MAITEKPSRQSAFAMRDTTKYYRFHKENGHDTSKCYQLKDHIEMIIREGHLKDVVIKKRDNTNKTDQKKTRKENRVPREVRMKEQSTPYFEALILDIVTKKEWPRY